MEYTMQAVLNRNLLKYAVQRAITCPKCRQILDVRRAVLFAVDGDAEGRQFMLCDRCYDNVSSLVTIDVLDGRQLYAKPEPSVKAPAERKPVHARDVGIGKRYEIHHTSGWVTVRVLRVNTLYGWGSRRPQNRTHYVCLNEKTGREIVVRSAAKFRKEVTE